MIEELMGRDPAGNVAASGQAPEALPVALAFGRWRLGMQSWPAAMCGPSPRALERVPICAVRCVSAPLNRSGILGVGYVRHQRQERQSCHAGGTAHHYDRLARSARGKGARRYLAATGPHRGYTGAVKRWCGLAWVWIAKELRVSSSTQPSDGPRVGSQLA
jgi:hypothetical protein